MEGDVAAGPPGSGVGTLIVKQDRAQGSFGEWTSPGSPPHAAGPVAITPSMLLSGKTLPLSTLFLQQRHDQAQPPQDSRVVNAGPTKNPDSSDHGWNRSSQHLGDLGTEPKQRVRNPSIPVSEHKIDPAQRLAGSLGISQRRQSQGPEHLVKPGFVRTKP